MVGAYERLKRGVRAVASRTEERQEDAFTCLACGAGVQDPLSRLGSLRCDECRSEDKRLDLDLVLNWQARGAPLQ